MRKNVNLFTFLDFTRLTHKKKRNQRLVVQKDVNNTIHALSTLLSSQVADVDLTPTLL